MKHLVITLMAVIGALFLYSCQGPLDSDINQFFETYGNKPSASGIPSSGTNGSDENKGQNPEEIARKLIGKWIIIKQIAFEDGEIYDCDLDGYHSGRKNQDYIVFYADFTYKQSTRYLFEATHESGTWSINDNTIVFDTGANPIYVIVQLNSSTLQLKWDMGDGDYELTTFRKAN